METKFRTQLGGYSKEDVNKYIKENDLKYASRLEELSLTIGNLQSRLNEAEEMSSRAEELEERLASCEKEKNELLVRCEVNQSRYESACLDIGTLNERIKRLTDELESEKSKNSQLSEEADELRSKAGEKDARLREMSDRLRLAESELEKIRSELVEKDRIISGLGSEPQNNKRDTEPDKTDLGDISDPTSPAYKLAKYDKISAEMGNIMIAARHEADEIIRCAKEEAEQLRVNTCVECEQRLREAEEGAAKTRAETEEEAAYIRERLSELSSGILNDMSADLHTNLESCMHEIEAGAADMKYEIKSMLNKIENGNREMNERIDYYQSCISEDIKAKLSLLDDKYGLKQSGEQKNV